MEKEKYIYCGTAFINQKKIFIYYHKDLKEIELFERKDGIFIPAYKEILNKQNSLFSNVKYLFDILKECFYYRKVKRSRFTSSFTENELKELHSTVEKNGNLKNEEKNILHNLISLEKGKAGYIDILKERILTVTIERKSMEDEDGCYSSEENIVTIDSELLCDRYENILRHEFCHLFQNQTTNYTPILYSWFKEGLTEMITLEYEPYFQEPKEDDYDFLVIVVKILFELFPNNTFFQSLQLDRYEDIYHTLRSKMSEEVFYTLFVKLSFYLDSGWFEDLDYFSLLTDVSVILVDLSRNETKEVRRKIKSYIREALDNNMVYRSNYIVGPKESFLYHKQKKIKVKDYKK